MFSIFEVRKNARAIYTYVRLAYVVSGIRSAYIYDPRIRQGILDLPNGSEVTISAYPSTYIIQALKTEKGLQCSLKKDFIVSSSAANVTFKSFDAALPVMNNFSSFKDAFSQNRCVIQGNVGLGMSIIHLLDMTQATLTTKRKRRKFLKEDVYSKEVEFKIKMTAWIKGWR